MTLQELLIAPCPTRGQKEQRLAAIVSLTAALTHRELMNERVEQLLSCIDDPDGREGRELIASAIDELPERLEEARDDLTRELGVRPGRERDWLTDYLERETGQPPAWQESAL